METRISVEATYRCEHCQSEVDVCDECSGRFIDAGEIADSIICYLEGDKHFCDKECEAKFISRKEAGTPKECLEGLKCFHSK